MMAQDYMSFGRPQMVGNYYEPYYIDVLECINDLATLFRAFERPLYDIHLPINYEELADKVEIIEGEYNEQFI